MDKFENFNQDILTLYDQLKILDIENSYPILIDDIDINDPKQAFIVRILLQKIRVFNLPLSFNWISIHFFAEAFNSPGRAIVGVIDLLEKFNLLPDSEPMIISIDTVFSLYDKQTYSHEYFENYVHYGIKNCQNFWHSLY